MSRGARVRVALVFLPCRSLHCKLQRWRLVFECSVTLTGFESCNRVVPGRLHREEGGPETKRCEEAITEASNGDEHACLLMGPVTVCGSKPWTVDSCAGRCTTSSGGTTALRERLISWSSIGSGELPLQYPLAIGGQRTRRHFGPSARAVSLSTTRVCGGLLCAGQRGMRGQSQRSTHRRHRHGCKALQMLRAGACDGSLTETCMLQRTRLQGNGSSSVLRSACVGCTRYVPWGPDELSTACRGRGSRCKTAWSKGGFAGLCRGLQRRCQLAMAPHRGPPNGQADMRATGEVSGGPRRLTRQPYSSPLHIDAGGSCTAALLHCCTAARRSGGPHHWGAHGVGC